jgi:hypothetical protein
MNQPYLTDDELQELRRLADAATPAPWRAMIEGRNHRAGDSFIMTGGEGDRREDLYLNRDSGPAAQPIMISSRPPGPTSTLFSMR